MSTGHDGRRASRRADRDNTAWIVTRRADTLNDSNMACVMRSRSPSCVSKQRDKKSQDRHETCGHVERLERGLCHARNTPLRTSPRYQSRATKKNVNPKRAQPPLSAVEVQRRGRAHSEIQTRVGKGQDALVRPKEHRDRRAEHMEHPG